MDSEEKEKLLRRIKAAVKTAREQRKSDLKKTQRFIWDGHSYGLERGFITQAHNENVATAKARGMIREDFRFWADPFDTGVKKAEPYEKRPSVRAGKKHRSKEAGLGI